MDDKKHVAIGIPSFFSLFFFKVWVDDEIRLFLDTKSFLSIWFWLKFWYIFIPPTWFIFSVRFSVLIFIHNVWHDKDIIANSNNNLKKKRLKTLTLIANKDMKAISRCRENSPRLRVLASPEQDRCMSENKNNTFQSVFQDILTISDFEKTVPRWP